MKLKEAVIAVTYRCNAKCSMCNIWRQTEHTEIPPCEYSKLPESLRVVNITGGEPFLRSDLVEVVERLSERLPSARLVFSTNGLLTGRVLSTMEEIREIHSNVGIGVSIDGGSKVHDNIRGVDGIYEAAIDTIMELKRHGFKDLRIGMTIVPENIGQILFVFETSKRLGVEFTITVAHNSEIYFKKTDNIGFISDIRLAEPLGAVARAQLDGFSIKNWLRAYHTSGIFTSSLRTAISSQCRAGRDYFFMAPNGDIFPCTVLEERIGNITNVSKFDQLFSSERMERLGEVVGNCREDCWMVCNTRSMMRKHPYPVTKWILKNKIRG